MIGDHTRAGLSSNCSYKSHRRSLKLCRSSPTSKRNPGNYLLVPRSISGDYADYVSTRPAIGLSLYIYIIGTVFVIVTLIISVWTSIY